MLTKIVAFRYLHLVGLIFAAGMAVVGEFDKGTVTGMAAKVLSYVTMFFVAGSKALPFLYKAAEVLPTDNPPVDTRTLYQTFADRAARTEEQSHIVPIITQPMQPTGKTEDK